MGLNYTEIAKCIASASKDQRYKVGALIYDANGNIRSSGYNGAPRGVEDYDCRYVKPEKQYFIAHAEENAIAQAARMGVSTDGCTMLIYGKTPCANCVRMIIQAGIKKVIFMSEDFRSSKYYASFLAGFDMLGEAGVTIEYFSQEEV